MAKNTSISVGDHFEGSGSQQIESERYGSATQVVRLEDHERQVTSLRQALIDGERSGEADELDMQKIKARARQQSSH
jgi:Uncharacterised protein family (UPF0156).